MDNPKKIQFEDRALKFLLDNNDDIGGEGFDSVSINKVFSRDEVMDLINKESGIIGFGIRSMVAPPKARKIPLNCTIASETKKKWGSFRASDSLILS